MPKRIHARKKSTIQKNLMNWFRSASRPFPWRENPSPYRIWISEIMAQQTRLVTMQPYFLRFVEKYPTIESLAKARLDDVLALWSGLGYYQRAKALYRAAQIVVSEYGGKLPSDPAKLRSLPGIGPYTAGAIASIAFNIQEPVLDGNVTRVLSRLFDVSDDTRASSTRAAFLGLAKKLVPSSEPGLFNQALMELGALVCTTTSPACPVCPLKKTCLAQKTGTVEIRPVKTSKPAPPVVRVLSGLVRCPDKTVLLVQNHYRGLFVGLWQLPYHIHLEGGPQRTEKEVLSRALQKSLGVRTQVVSNLGNVKHVLTHRYLDVDLYDCRVRNKSLVLNGYRSYRWIQSKSELTSLGVASLTHKLLAILQNKKGCS